MPSNSVRSVALGGLSFSLALGLAAAASFGEGCVSASNPAAADDAGGMDGAGPGLDGGGAHEDGSSSDTGAGDAADGAAPACTSHLAAGFTQVVASQTIVATLTGNGTGRVQAMLLDENDDPMFVYSAYDSSTSWSVDFVRWDACTGQFTTPIVVDTLHPFDASTDVAIGYDPTTHEIAIVYEKGETDNNWADDYTETWLATMKAPATTFTTQPLSSGATDFGSTASPTIAMANGNLYVAFAEGPYDAIEDGNFPYVVWFLSSTATPTPLPSGPPLSDGGAAPPFDAGAADAGPAPPHYFTYQAVPFTSADVGADNHLFAGYVDPQTGSSNLSIAVDSSGAPALAAFETPDSNGNQQLLYWRPSTATAVSVYAFNLDGNPDVTLSFEGTKPRIAGHMDTPVEADASAVVPDSLTFFASNDGVTWSSAVHLPSNDDSQITAFTSALALDGAGHAAVASDVNSGNGEGCGANPYIATSSDDDGGPWTACGADTAGVHGYDSDSVSAAYGASRANGTLVVSFVSNASTENDAGAAKAGIIYWQHP